MSSNDRDVHPWGRESGNEGTDNETEKSASSSKSREAESSSSSSSGRPKRVTVTPRDYEELEAVCEQLGLSKSGAYRLAMKRLIDEMGLDV